MSRFRNQVFWQNAGISGYIIFWGNHQAVFDKSDGSIKSPKAVKPWGFFISHSFTSSPIRKSYSNFSKSACAFWAFWITDH
jgi:hypothetical protein